MDYCEQCRILRRLGAPCFSPACDFQKRILRHSLLSERRRDEITSILITPIATRLIAIPHVQQMRPGCWDARCAIPSDPPHIPYLSRQNECWARPSWALHTCLALIFSLVHKRKRFSTSTMRDYFFVCFHPSFQTFWPLPHKQPTFLAHEL